MHDAFNETLILLARNFKSEGCRERRERSLINIRQSNSLVTTFKFKVMGGRVGTTQDPEQI